MSSTRTSAIALVAFVSLVGLGVSEALFPVLPRQPRPQWNDLSYRDNGLKRFHKSDGNRIQRSTVLHSEDSEDGDKYVGDRLGPMDDDSAGAKRKLTTARAGGRGRRPPPREANPKRQRRFPGWLSASVLGLLLLWALSGIINGGSGDNFYYYSYSSSIYETRTYDANGQVQSQRKESNDFRSNIPGLSRGDAASTITAADMLRENQRFLDRQEDEFFDAFPTAANIRSLEDLLDESYE